MKKCAICDQGVTSGPVVHADCLEELRAYKRADRHLVVLLSACLFCLMAAVMVIVLLST